MKHDDPLNPASSLSAKEHLTLSESAAERIKPRYKLLCICDSPTLETGFARVIKNLLPHWLESKEFEEIHVWGIGYQGWPHELDVEIFPAQAIGADHWFLDENLQRLLHLLSMSDYTHVWVMQDLFHVCRFAKSFGEICQRKNIRSLIYYPVDAPVDAMWVRALREFDVAVAYSEYGFAEVKRHKESANLKKIILPHGVNTEHYHPEADRAACRLMFRDATAKAALDKEDFLIVNVNAHQKRKGLAQTLQIFAGLSRRWSTLDRPGKPWLYLHMPPVNVAEQSDLKNLAVQLGLMGSVMFGETAFNGNAPRLDEGSLRKVYCAADLYLTTTLGEGWGLTITEAMACGTPVAAPHHTSIVELLDPPSPYDGEHMLGLPLKTGANIVLPNDNMRQRPVTDVSCAVELILDVLRRGPNEQDSLARNADRALVWMNHPKFKWGSIAAEWMKLMFP